MTLTAIAPSIHPGVAHAHNRPGLDPRFLLCSVTDRKGRLCQDPWRIPEKPAPAAPRSRTSREAAGKIEGQPRDHYRQRVYEAFRKAGVAWRNPDPFGVVMGLTDEEGIEATGIPASTFRPRRIELVRDNLIEDSQLTRPTKSGRQATVWTIRE